MAINKVLDNESKRKLMLKLTIAMSFLCVLSNALVAEPRPTMTAVDILNISALEESTISPNGKKMVFIKSDANWKLNKTVQNIWISDLSGGEPRQLTFDESGKTRLRWSPNGEAISFVSQRNGLSDSAHFKGIYLLPIEGGEARELTSHRADIRAYRWSSDSKSIYFLASELLNANVAEAKRKRDDMFAFEEALSYQHIWHLDIKKKFTRQVTHGSFHVLDFDLSNDDETLAYNRAKGDLLDDWYQSEVWTSDKYGGNQQKLTSNHYAERSLEFSPDDKHLLFLSDTNLQGLPYFDSNLFVISRETKKISLLGEKEVYEVEAAHWNKNSKDIFVLANMGVHSEIWRLSLEGEKPAQLTEGRHTIKNWRYDTQSNRHSFVLVTSNNPGEFAFLSPKSQKILKVTSLHKTLKKKFKLPRQNLITWKAEDGTKIEGLLSYPINYISSRRYPLVVHAHGGPASSDQYGQFSWSTYIPLVTANNFFYFSINYRGSRGYGDAFMRDMVGHYFNQGHLDILSGIDYLIAQGLVDSKKLIMSGWSAGGHMTNYLITQTNRFSAASSGAGAVEWMSMFGESDERFDRRQWFSGTPWEENAGLDHFLKDSPLKDLWKVKTPTIIFVGEKDQRVPPSQSKILHRALRDLGVESKLYIAPREPHSFQELRHRLFKINAELDWFKQHTGQPKKDWVKAPES